MVLARIVTRLQRLLERLGLDPSRALCHSARGRRLEKDADARLGSRLLSAMRIGLRSARQRRGPGTDRSRLEQTAINA